ncbi:MAG: hypothetical protein IJ083_16345 [Clostridia bacterium]|nr:hypothetical protein [Clostridia bacterium]
MRVSCGAVLTLKDCTSQASSDNATGIFACDTGSVSLYDSTVTASGGGTLDREILTVRISSLDADLSQITA